MKLIGYMVSNGCIALFWFPLIKDNGFCFGLNSGVGVIVIGLSIDHYRGSPFQLINLFWVRLITVVSWCDFLYRLILAIVFEFNDRLQIQNFASAIVLVICLSLLTKFRRNFGLQNFFRKPKEVSMTTPVLADPQIYC